MSDTPNAGNGKYEGAVPATTGGFLILAGVLVLVWTTGSWVHKLSDWSDQGFFDASIGQIVGTLAGGAAKYFVIVAVPVLLWRSGRVIPRPQYRRLSLGLLALGLACLGFALVVKSDGPVATWPEWLLISLIVHPTLSGVLGLGHCALLTRRERTNLRS
ncbi:hypothetical protein [Nonomuraea sp. NPDC005650]|uniref:hypothetical protein n=1 Tax=Nonomuraea sp. NPDC005650 TaxID=3157045 RepID=UPI0033BC801E